MVEELLRSRRACTLTNTERLDKACEQLGMRPVRMFTKVEHNDMTKAEEKVCILKHIEESNKLREAMNLTSNSKISRKASDGGKYPVLFSDNDKVDGIKEVVNPNLTLQEKARLDYQNRVARNKQVAEENQKWNYYQANQIHNGSDQTLFLDEVVNELKESVNAGPDISCSRKYLAQEHQTMYASQNYKDIVEVKKSRFLDQTTDTSLSQLQTEVIHYNIEQDKMELSSNCSQLSDIEII